MKKLIISILLLNTFFLFGQEKQNTMKFFWIELGFGADNNGISGQLSSNWSIKSRLIRFRYIGSTEIFILGSKSPRNTMNDIGILYGKSFIRKCVSYVVSGGVGIIAGKRRSNFLGSNGQLFGTEYYEKKRILNIGIPIEIECKLRPSKNAGIGIGVYGNINLDRPICGLQAKIYLR
jgi:hypothetical protein